MANGEQLNGKSILARRVMETIIIGVIVGAVSVYGASIKQEVININLNAGLARLETKIEKIADVMIAHMTEEKNFNQVTAAKSWEHRDKELVEIKKRLVHIENK